jgi:hypothetical protein
VNLAAVRRRIEFSDLLLLFYALVFIREYAWIVPNNLAAWAVSVVVTLALWVTYLKFKPDADYRVPRVFWITVALPLLIVYVSRAAIPDLSFDVLNHRLIQGERALRGPQLLPGDFFPNVFPFNPSSDMLTGMFRHVLGYRLGTVLNLLALIWTGIILEKILRPLLAGAWQRCLAVFLVLFTEHMMFEIDTYMVDLLALPLILEATRLALGFDETKSRSWDLAWSALLLGGAVGLKLTNAVLVIPVMIVFAIRLAARERDQRIFRDLGVAAILFMLPLLPHVIYIYRQTGNPFFPLYNDIFHSAYWPDNRMGDGRWGPRNLRETFAWPLITFWMPKRLSELGLYAGRLTLGVIAAFVCVVPPRIPARVKLLGLICLLGAWAWSFTSGYLRYALFIEILGGLLLICLANYLLIQLKTIPRGLRLSIASLPIALLLAQCVLSASYVRKTEWSQRPISIKATADEIRWIGRDRDLLSFQSAENRQSFAKVDAWVVSSVKSNGVEALLRPNVPALGINYNEYFDKPASRQLFSRALNNLRGKRTYSLVLDDELDSALDSLKRRNLVAGHISNVIIPFYSLRTQFHMTLIEVLVPESNGAMRRPPGQPDITDITGPLNDDAFVATLSASNFPTAIKAGQIATINVQVTNASAYTWHSRSNKPPAYVINVADIWFRADGKTMVTNMDGRSTLTRDVWPGESGTVQLSIKAPAAPGEYVLEIDLVQEGVAFFKEKGSHTWRTPIKVE